MASDVSRIDYWNGSTAPDFAYWDELSENAVFAWEDTAPVEKPQSRPNRSAVAGSQVARKADVRPARKPTLESAWEARDEAVARFNALPTYIVMAAVTAIFIVALAIVGMVRIGWSSDTVLVQKHSQELTETITSTRLAGRLLEVQRGSMVNASRIRVEALYRGMMEPETTESLVLKPDTIVVDEAGNLSLSGSIARVAESS